MATQYYAVAHPSLPNYLAMISGSTHSCTSNGCQGNYRGRTLAGQFSGHGLRWRGFIEGLPEPGYTGRDSGKYTRHHNPFVYFRSIVQKPRQRNRIVPFRQFRRSLRRPPALSYIVPTDDHNMHSGSEGVADAWLHNWIPRVMASRGFRHHGAIFITWDEASKGDSSGCCVAGVHGGHQPLDRDRPQRPAATSASRSAAPPTRSCGRSRPASGSRTSGTRPRRVRSRSSSSPRRSATAR